MARYLVGSDLDRPVPYGKDQCLNPRADMQLPQDVDKVRAYRLRADVQPLTNFTVAQPFGQHLQDLELTGSQPVKRLRRRVLVLAPQAGHAKEVDHLLGR